jgi:O-antigen ligase
VLFLVYAAVLLFVVPSQQGLQNWLVWCLMPATAVLVARRTTPATPARVYRLWLPAALTAAAIYSALALRHGAGYAGNWYSARGMGWHLLLAMAMVVAFQRWRAAFLYWPVWALAVVIGSTLTRSAGLLALLSATGLAVLNRAGRLSRARFLAFLAAMGFVGFYAATRITAIRDRFTEGDAAVQFHGADLNTSGRLKLWSATWHAVSEHPWFGHGPGQSQYFIKARFVTIEHPHNEYLRMLYDTGWVGAVLWLVGMLLILRGCWRRMRASSDSLRRATHLAAVLAMLDLLLGSITDNLTVSPSFALACGTLLGLSLGLPEVRRREAPASEPEWAPAGVPTPLTTRSRDSFSPG